MTSKQKRKGDNYERELAQYFNKQVFGGNEQCGRAPLSGGGFVGITGGADLVGTTGLFIEAKRQEAVRLINALKQAEYNKIKTHAPEAPIVISRQNGMTTGQSYTMLRLDHFLVFYRAWLKDQGYTYEDAPAEPDPNQLDMMLNLSHTGGSNEC